MRTGTDCKSVYYNLLCLFKHKHVDSIMFSRLDSSVGARTCFLFPDLIDLWEPEYALNFPTWFICGSQNMLSISQLDSSVRARICSRFPDLIHLWEPVLSISFGSTFLRQGFLYFNSFLCFLYNVKKVIVSLFLFNCFSCECLIRFWISDSIGRSQIAFFSNRV